MKFKIEFSNERIITPSGPALVGILLDKTNFKERIDNIKIKDIKKHNFKNSDILIPYIGMLCQGKSDFDSVNEMYAAKEYYKNALNVKKIPSSYKMNERMNQIGTKLTSIIYEENAKLLKNSKTRIISCHRDYIPLDVDVSLFKNSNTKKTCVSGTYKGTDGYVPILAYLGMTGYLLNAELRSNSMPYKKGIYDFLNDTLKYAKKVTDAPLLLRMDSGVHADNINLYYQYQCDFVIKKDLKHKSKQMWKKISVDNEDNHVEKPRDGKKVYISSVYRDVKGIDQKVRIVYKIIERTIDEDGQILLSPELEVETYWTSLDINEKKIIELYHKHDTSEQYYSEIKNNMDLKRFPSNSYDTNTLVLKLAVIAYNILRIIGKASIKGDKASAKEGIIGKRLKTVIKNLIKPYF